MTERKRKIHLAVTAIVMLLIFIHSAMPGDMSGAESGFIVKIIVALTGLPAEPLGLVVRKAAHFTEFMILGMAIAVNVRDYLVPAQEHRSANLLPAQEHRPANLTSEQEPQAQEHRPAKRVPLLKAWAVTWILGTLYAVTDEFHQLFVPGRVGAVMDVCIDSAGVAAGALIMWLILVRREKDQS